MKLAKSVLLMSMGAGITLMYQKYSKPICQEMNKMIDKAINKVSELEM